MSTNRSKKEYGNKERENLLHYRKGLLKEKQGVVFLNKPVYCSAYPYTEHRNYPLQGFHSHFLLNNSLTPQQCMSRRWDDAEGKGNDMTGHKVCPMCCLLTEFTSVVDCALYTGGPIENGSQRMEWILPFGFFVPFFSNYVQFWLR